MAWGTLRPASESKGPLLTKFKELLTPAYLQGADLPHGRQLFTRHCCYCTPMKIRWTASWEKDMTRTQC